MTAYFAAYQFVHYINWNTALKKHYNATNYSFIVARLSCFPQTEWWSISFWALKQWMLKTVFFLIISSPTLWLPSHYVGTSSFSNLCSSHDLVYRYIIEVLQQREVRFDDELLACHHEMLPSAHKFSACSGTLMGIYLSQLWMNHIVLNWQDLWDSKIEAAVGGYCDMPLLYNGIYCQEAENCRW